MTKREIKTDVEKPVGLQIDVHCHMMMFTKVHL